MKKFVAPFFLTTVLVLGHVQAKDVKKRTAASMPAGAVGMPAGAVGMPASGFGSGMPPGAMGMPVPEDQSCRRAAGLAVIADAEDDLHNAVDCRIESVNVTEMNQKYQVMASCGEGIDLYYKVKTRVTKKGCKILSLTVVPAPRPVGMPPGAMGMPVQDDQK